MTGIIEITSPSPIFTVIFLRGDYFSKNWKSNTNSELSLNISPVIFPLNCLYFSIQTIFIPLPIFTSARCWVSGQKRFESPGPVNTSCFLHLFMMITWNMLARPCQQAPPKAWCVRSKSAWLDFHNYPPPAWPIIITLFFSGQFAPHSPQSPSTN